jgi:hypothetical protein
MIKSSCHIYFLCLLDNKITHNAIRIGYFEFMNFFLLYYDTFNKILGFTNKCILTFHRILYFRNNNLGSKCNECTSINLRWYMSKFFDRPLIYFLAPPLIWMEFTSMLGTTTLQPVQFPCTSCWARVVLLLLRAVAKQSFLWTTIVPQSTISVRQRSLKHNINVQLLVGINL